MIGPFPWYYQPSLEDCEYASDRRYEPIWNEEKRDWNEWRLRLPPEWRHSDLTNAPDKLKRRLGLMSYPFVNGDASCTTCKNCICYDTCKQNHMHGQANCASHQLWCEHNHFAVEQMTMEDFA